MKTDKQIALAAAEFAGRWQGKGYEKGESQLFWADLLTTVFGVENLLLLSVMKNRYIAWWPPRRAHTYVQWFTMGVRLF